VCPDWVDYGFRTNYKYIRGAGEAPPMTMTVLPT
jgi:hypothetical protein